MSDLRPFGATAVIEVKGAKLWRSSVQERFEISAPDHLAAAKIWFAQQAKNHQAAVVEMIAYTIMGARTNWPAEPEVSFIPNEGWRRLDAHDMRAIWDTYAPTLTFALSPNQSRVLDALSKQKAATPVMSPAVLNVLLPLQHFGLVVIDQINRPAKTNADGSVGEGEGSVTITQHGRAVALHRSTP